MNEPDTIQTIQIFRAPDGGPDRDAAMLANDGRREWHGTPLCEWDLLRESHFMLMRGVARAPRMADLLSCPGAFLPDALRILWLCTLDDHGLRTAARGDMQAACDAWCRANVPLDRAGEAMSLALEAYNEAHSCDTEPAPRPGLEESDGNPT